MQNDKENNYDKEKEKDKKKEKEKESKKEKERKKEKKKSVRKRKRDIESIYGLSRYIVFVYIIDSLPSLMRLPSLMSAISISDI